MTSMLTAAVPCLALFGPPQKHCLHLGLKQKAIGSSGRPNFEVDS